MTSCPAPHYLVTGATGMIGRALVARLRSSGIQVTSLTRQSGLPDSRVWNPAAGHLDLNGLPPIDAAIHLAGENLAAGRWTMRRRHAILSSRVDSTRLLASALASHQPRPGALVCASGVSAYPADGAAHDESSPLDTSTFLGTVVANWEAAAAPAREAGIRVVHLRLGAVLSPTGGALAALLPLFKLGLGGTIGTGFRGFPWLALDDAAALFHRAAADPAFVGPVNAVAPSHGTNRDFTRALASTLHRPAMLPVPPVLLHWLFGAMADELLLGNLHVRPAKLLKLAYPFLHPTLASALDQIPSPPREIGLG